MDLERARRQEWLEADGLGGFASGTVSGIRTRRYHALLLAATTPPTGRVVLVNGFDAWITTGSTSVPLTSQLYVPGVRHPDGETRIQSFEPEPWPTWVYRLEDGSLVRQEVIAWHEKSTVALSFALVAGTKAELTLRPFLSGRDYHGLHHENPSFRFDAAVDGERVVFRPYDGLPPISSVGNGVYRHQPLWYRNFLYENERERGLDFSEDLASPGELTFDLGKGEAIWIVSSDPGALEGTSATDLVATIRTAERRRRKAFPSRLHRAADAYLVRRRGGSTIVAGYPWFTDWGRDTFIALRGLCLAGGRLPEAEAILLEWADAVSEGMLPNRFADHGESPEYNSVDASLWYVVAVRDFLKKVRKPRPRLTEACHAIIEGYRRGTRYGIRADEDGLLACGEPGVQLTWMDAKVGDWVVTPRIGKPVEVQALWLNALSFSREWKARLDKGLSSFERRFWYEEGGYLYDVVDVDHVPGTVDASLRPNQVFAVGGLPDAVLQDKKKARAVVDVIERKLWTPLGLRSLSPDDSRYVPRYQGGVVERDGSYHQGTVWPWLIGAFVDAWSRANGQSGEAKARFLDPLLQHLDDAGLGHLPEIADADPPHTPRGCPFQAWSVGEALRVAQMSIRVGRRPKRPRPGASKRPPPPTVHA
ncbi:MAG TPA: amylo-alpha-1,6-glucosidase [Vicinamibacteria bacterium]|nr:amylo-alpha-1,6-glucosidase [Vicinamibacteria bacterium]